MKRLTASLVILSLLGLNGAVLAASAGCPLASRGPGPAKACCCGDEGSCNLPPDDTSLASVCCEVTGKEPPADASDPAVPVVGIPQLQTAFVETGFDAPRNPAPAFRIVADVPDTGRPPPYRLFCSLLI